MRASSACQRCLTHLRPTESLLRSSPRSLIHPHRWPARPASTVLPQSRRTITSMFQATKKEAPPPNPSDVVATTSQHLPATHTDQSRLLLRPNNLFHPMESSPSPSMRERAAVIKRTAYCPHPEHKHANSPEHVAYTCPDCGVPVYCSEDHWADDYESHLQICDTLREVNEDDHDLRSGRFFPEFEYPSEQLEEQLVNFTNWDTFLYTRDFKAVDDERQMRQVTKLLTYPMTVASVVHELSPYTLRHRLTKEGLRSFSALRYTLHPDPSGGGQEIKNIRFSPPPIRLFILGARAESSLPRDVWYQLSHLFPRASFHLVFIGPESMANREDEYPLPDRSPANPFGAVVERVSHTMKISTIAEYFHTLHDTGTFAPYDPYFDMFVLFHPGLGHPGSSAEWEHTLPKLLETKLPVLCTGYTEADMKRDVDWVHEKCKGEFDVLLEPGKNRLGSWRWDLNDADPTDLSQSNWGHWAFRGKRYEATTKEEPPV